MSIKDFDNLGIENFVVFRAHEARNWHMESEGAEYVAGHTYYIVSRVTKDNAKHCYLIDSVGICYQFSSVNGYEFRFWQSELSNCCKIVYKGKDFVDAWNFTQNQPDVEKFV